MTPKEKATELVSRFKEFISYTGQLENDLLDDARGMALICVDEIIRTLDAFGYVGTMYDDFETGQIVTTGTTDADPCDYWKKG